MKTFRRGRLQRAANADGYRVETFADVIKRHGGTMGGIALICLLLPGGWRQVVETTSAATANPLPYILATLGLLVFFALWSRRRPFVPLRQIQWVFYLLFISIVEELGFRLFLPNLFATGMSGVTAVVLSNFIFAALHYVTLRWKLKNCIATFFGGLGLAHLMGQGDLTLVILVHWLGTFLNTPSPPSR